jgi:hypothetical protein
MLTTVLRFGGFAGLIITAMIYGSSFIWLRNMDFKTGEAIGYSSMFIGLSLIYFAIRGYRDKVSDGFISFGKALLVGVNVTLVASAIYVAAWVLFIQFVAPDFMDRYFDYQLEKVKESSTAADMDTKLEQMMKLRDLYKSPLVQIFTSFLEIFPLGVVVSLIFSAFLRRRKEIA